LKELLNEITACRTEIAPHVERFQTSLAKHTCPDPLAYFAARTHAALVSLERIVTKHLQKTYLTTGLGNQDFTKAEHAIDIIRHVGVKISQSNTECGKRRPGFTTSIYQKSQEWLLAKSRGTTHADAILWQFANRDIPRHSKPYFDDNGKVGASRQLWPPTKRTMRETRKWLSPGLSLSTTPWTKDIHFDDGKMVLSDLAPENRQRALASLEISKELSPWDKHLVGAAIERSLNGGPGMLNALTSFSYLSALLPSLPSIRNPFAPAKPHDSALEGLFVLEEDSDADDERRSQNREDGQFSDLFGDERCPGALFRPYNYRV